MKRVFDIIASLILLIAGAPVMVVTALLIGLETGFPLLYRQERVGHNGRLFNVIKFRSMRQHAEKHGKPVWATFFSSDNLFEVQQTELLEKISPRYMLVHPFPNCPK